MRLRTLFYSCLFLVSISLWSQKIVERGHKQFQDLAYSNAIIQLEKAVQNGYTSARIYSELADSYYFNANYQAAAKWYQLLFKKSKSSEQIHYFRYIQSLKSVGKEDEASKIMQQMNDKSGNGTLTFLSSSETAASDRTKNAGKYAVELASFNSSFSDFGAAYYGNQLVFASTRDTASIFKRSHSWTNQSFTDLYVVHPDSLHEKPIRFSKKINSNFNQSSAVWTKDGLTCYFTSTTFNYNKRGKNKNRNGVLKIYKAVKEEGDWNVIGALPFCNDRYNVAHPALSPDEKTMYFASDMPGGFGASDLYKVSFNAAGGFGTPTNLGPKINTLGRETFPFISQKQELYFSSDVHAGQGGLDLFIAFMDENSNFSAPRHLGEPLNSKMDDFGLIIDEASKTGYFTSNRANGMGSDDLYRFTELEAPSCESTIQGAIETEESSENQISGVEILLLDADAQVIKTTTTDENGRYQFTVNCHQHYVVQIKLLGGTVEPKAVESKMDATVNVPILLIKKQLNRFQVGDDLVKKCALLPIYFDTGESLIRFDAAVELLKIRNILLDFPQMNVEIRSHTDSRDTAEHNQKLSTRRAQATVIWLTENGIESSRLSGIGFGETQLLNQCSDGNSCSENQHQQNRRSEFIVTKI